MSILTLANSLQEAKESRTAIQQLTTAHPGLSIQEAYQIQNVLLENSLSKGEKLAGYKMGLTSLAKQRDVGVNEAIRGFLLKSEEVSLGSQWDVSTRIHPRVEPEVAVILKRKLEGNVTVQDVAASIDRILPAIEIIDSRFDNFKFTLPDVIADNCSASGYVLGSNDLPLEDLPLLGVTLRKNGVIEQTGAPAAVLGHPFVSVVELVRALSRERRAVEPGMVILTGGITASVTVGKNDVIECVWPHETLTLRCSEVNHVSASH